MRMPERVALLLAGAALCTFACSSNDSANSGGSSTGGSNSDTGGSSTGTGGSSTGGADLGGAAGMGGSGGGDTGPSCPATTADVSCVCTSELLGPGGAPNSGDDVCFDYPAACGDIGSYTLILGTDVGEVFDSGTGTDLVVGLGGDDTFSQHYGNDCYVGGPGDDRLEQSAEASYHVMMGGPGADTFALGGPNYNEVTIVDMSGEDTVALDWTAFARGAGSAGTPLGSAIETLSNFDAGEPSTTDTRIIYDPTDGELWWEDGEVSHLVGKIENHDEYVFDPDDFVWE